MGARWSTSVAAPPISTAYNLPVREGMLTVGTVDGRVRLVDAATRMTRWEVQSYPANHFCSVAVSPDGRFVASVGESEEHWKIFDAASGVVCVTGPRHDGTGACLCRVTRSGHRTLLDEGCPVHAHTAGLEVVAFSPCGQTLATGGGAFTVILWDAQTGKAELMLEKLTDWVTSVSFSADGARLASGSEDLSIRVWDTSTGDILRTFLGSHDTFVFQVQFSPADNRVLVSTGVPESRLKLWDVDSGEMLRSFGFCILAEFGPDGRRIATLSNSDFNVFHLVNAESGVVLSTLASHTGYVSSISFSVNGSNESKLASGSYDGTCKVWDSSTGALLRTIEVGSTIFSVFWGRDWVMDTQRAMAFAMGHHPRLGERSQMLALDAEVVRMILDRV
mmetsp:Transcript_19987/g.48407  ORF Transcript_19987/g.48407 Transcript_19987/m.48407 type:complete len:391 (+) Transcript_19987:93-1265(+)